MTISPPWRKASGGLVVSWAPWHFTPGQPVEDPRLTTLPPNGRRRYGTSMKTAAHLLKSKAHQSVYTITPEASVFDAVQLMADKDIGALLVMDADEIAGIVTERDYARKIVLMSRSSKQTSVREIMTSAVMYVRPDQTSEECMVLMTENRLRHLPVMDAGRLLGIISIGDLVKDIIAEQRFTIEQLEHYISGDRG
jgi:CBS domain-containing protein